MAFKIFSENVESSFNEYIICRNENSKLIRLLIYTSVLKKLTIISVFRCPLFSFLFCGVILLFGPQYNKYKQIDDLVLLRDVRRRRSGQNPKPQQQQPPLARMAGRPANPGAPVTHAWATGG
jgi:hypothetical protein